MKGSELFNLIRNNDIRGTDRPWSSMTIADRQKWNTVAEHLDYDPPEEDDDEPEDTPTPSVNMCFEPPRHVRTYGIPSPKYGPLIFWLPGGCEPRGWAGRDQEYVESPEGNGFVESGWYYFDVDYKLSKPHFSDEAAFDSVVDFCTRVGKTMEERSDLLQKEINFMTRFSLLPTPRN